MKTVAECLIAIAVMMVALAFFDGCVTGQSGQKKIDECKALNTVQGGHQIAEGASSIVCTFITDKVKRAKCFEYQKTASKAGSALVNIAATIMKACGLAP